MKKLAVLALLGAACLNAVAQADGYPSRTIRIVVPFGPGSGSDAMARYYADKIGPLLGQAVIVENRPGADGAIGMSLAKSAPADGYTIVQGGVSPAAVNAALIPNLPYDPVKDFKVVYSYGRNMIALVTRTGGKVGSFDDMKKHAASAQAPLTVGTFSTFYNLSAERLARAAGMQFNQIPYKGQSQALNDVMGGQIDYALVDISGALPLIKQGKLTALLVSGEQRHHELEEVATAKELGMPGYVIYSWNAFFVRDEVPEPIRLKLAAAIKQVTESPDTINNFFKPRGSDVRGITPEDMRTLQVKMIEDFRKVADAAPMTR